jgi:hypothetical protein
VTVLPSVRPRMFSPSGSVYPSGSARPGSWPAVIFPVASVSCSYLLPVRPSSARVLSPDQAIRYGTVPSAAQVCIG